MHYCSLSSGSCGNSHFIKTKNKNILIDVGKTRKYIVESLCRINEDINKVDAVIISHEHSDHIKGLDVLSKNYDFDIYINRLSYEAVKDRFKYINENRITFIDGSFNIGDVYIEPFNLSHDAVNTYGFIVSSENKKIGICTDLGEYNDLIVQLLSDCDLIAIESNYDTNLIMMSNYPYSLKRRIKSIYGHLSNDECAELTYKAYNVKKRIRTIVLSHLSKENNNEDIAYLTIKEYFNKRNIIEGNHYYLAVSKRDEVGPIFRV